VFFVFFVVEKDERRTSNIERPTSNEKEASTLGILGISNFRHF